MWKYLLEQLYVDKWILVLKKYIFKITCIEKVPGLCTCTCQKVHEQCNILVNETRLKCAKFVAFIIKIKHVCHVCININVFKSTKRCYLFCLCILPILSQILCAASICACVGPPFFDANDTLVELFVPLFPPLFLLVVVVPLIFVDVFAEIFLVGLFGILEGSSAHCDTASVLPTALLPPGRFNANGFPPALKPLPPPPPVLLRCLLGFIFAFEDAVGLGIIETRLDTIGGT